MRLFLSIALPPEVQELALQTQEELRALITRQGVRFSAPSKMHLTLCFLGDDREQDEVHAIASQVLSGRGPLSLTAGGLGVFPDTRRPKSVWLAVNGEGLQSLADDLAAGFGIELEPFVGHVTLARITPGSKAVGWLLAPILKVAPAGASLQQWSAEEIQLATALGSGEYQVLERYPLM